MEIIQQDNPPLHFCLLHCHSCASLSTRIVSCFVLFIFMAILDTVSSRLPSPLAFHCLFYFARTPFSSPFYRANPPEPDSLQERGDPPLRPTALTSFRKETRSDVPRFPGDDRGANRLTRKPNPQSRRPNENRWYDSPITDLRPPLPRATDSRVAAESREWGIRRRETTRARP